MVGINLTVSMASSRINLSTSIGSNSRMMIDVPPRMNQGNTKNPAP